MWSLVIVRNNAPARSVIKVAVGDGAGTPGQRAVCADTCHGDRACTDHRGVTAVVAYELLKKSVSSSRGQD
jgi:hypothetical protein